MLEVRGVSKRFGGLAALDGVTFEVAAGETLGIMGANGAGKTTLFALIAGIERPSAGEIRFAGRAISGLGADAVNRRGIARTYQIVRPFAALSVLDNVAVGRLFGSAPARSPAAARAEARAILADTGLADRADRPAGELTVAGLKRLELARALATRPRLLLLDEVLAGLTPPEVAEAVALLGRLQAQHGLTLVVIEHVMRALMRMCRRIVVLDHGVLIAAGTPEAVANDAQVRAAYLGSAG